MVATNFLDGQEPSIYLLFDKGQTGASLVLGLVSWTKDDGSTEIDQTNAGSGDYTQTKSGRSKGTITAEVLYTDDDTALIAALASRTTPVDCYFRVFDDQTDAVYAWSCLLTEAVATGGMTGTSKRTVKFNRQGEAS